MTRRQPVGVLRRQHWAVPQRLPDWLEAVKTDLASRPRVIKSTTKECS